MTPFSKSLADEGMQQTIDYLYQYTFPPAFHLPTFLYANEYQNPSKKDNNRFKHWCGDSFFEFHAMTSGASSKFNAFMKATGSRRGTFSEFYPCDDLSCNPSDTLIVDIGGNIGHDLQAFRSKHPDASGRLVLQDLPEVIENAMTMPWASSVEMQKHDFFTPQTVMGAKIYLLHTVLHDWPDADVVKILKNVKPALRTNYSKLLIHEIVVEEIRPNLEATSRDWIMLLLNSGLERSGRQWKTLIASAGLKITQIYKSPLYLESVIETELA